VDGQAQQGWTIGGENPVKNFISGLSGRNLAEAEALIRLLQERGNTLRSRHSRPLGDGLFELRGHQVRIFYMFLPGRQIRLLDGIIKQQDEIPQRVLKRVRKAMADISKAEKEGRITGEASE
jgi:hypothetical protein